MRKSMNEIMQQGRDFYKTAKKEPIYIIETRETSASKKKRLMNVKPVIVGQGVFFEKRNGGRLTDMIPFADVMFISDSETGEIIKDERSEK